MPDTKMTPGKRCEAALKQLNVDRKSFSEALGVSLPSVSMYFTGRLQIRPVVALAMQAVYGVNARWILNGESPQFISDNAQQMSKDAMDIGSMFDDLNGGMKTKARQVLESISNSNKSEA